MALLQRIELARLVARIVRWKRQSCNRQRIHVRARQRWNGQGEATRRGHTDVGHRCVGAHVNGKMVPLHYELRSGDSVEVLTSMRERGPSREWLEIVKTARARKKIKQWFRVKSRLDTEQTGRDLLHAHLEKQGLPAPEMTGSLQLADLSRGMGFGHATDFYIALGSGRILPAVAFPRLLPRLRSASLLPWGSVAPGVRRSPLPGRLRTSC